MPAISPQRSFIVISMSARTYYGRNQTVPRGSHRANSFTHRGSCAGDRGVVAFQTHCPGIGKRTAGPIRRRAETTREKECVWHAAALRHRGDSRVRECSERS